MKLLSFMQGVPQNITHFCPLNFSASLRSRSFILDIFQQPLSCRFLKYPVFYYLVKSGPRYCQNTKRQSFLELTFCIYYRIKQISNQDHSGVIMSTHEHLWALRSTHEESCVWGNGSWLPMIAQGAMYLSHDSLWVSMRVVGATAPAPC